MKLFIRSQNKESLIELQDNIYIDNRLDKYYLIARPLDKEIDETILGKFERKENAIKVLDEMQRILIFPTLACETGYKIYQVPKEEEIDK